MGGCAALRQGSRVLAYLAMEKLSPEQRLDACSVLSTRYKACAKRVMMSEVVRGEIGAVKEQCGDVWDMLTEHCTDFLKQGRLAARAPPPA